MDPLELHEVGCGLGADSVFLSQHFPLISYEQDEARALLASANIEALGGTHPSEVICQKVDLAKLEVEVLFCDPARRQDRREFDPEKWSPPLSQLVGLWETGKVRALGVKCAPGLKEQPEGGELHFLSLQGELKEAFLWFGPGSDAGQRTAWVLGERWERWTGSQGSPTVRAPRVGEFLHNPDPAILRARALDTLANQLNAAQLQSQIGYLSGPTPSVTRSATSFEIRHVQELNWKSLNQALAAQGWREFEYLGRGVPFSQLEVRKRLNRASKAMKKKGKGRGTVVIYRADHGYISLLCQRRECLQELE